MQRLALTVRETAEALGVSEKTILRMIKERRIKAIRVGARKYIVPLEALKRYLEDEKP